MIPTLVLFGGFFVFLGVGIPIPFALILSSLVVFLMNPATPAWVLAQRAVSGIDSFVLVAIPFFILAGNIMNAGGITERLLKLAMALVGHIRGGLSHVTVVVGMFFAGISGSSVAESGALSTLFIPSMVRRIIIPPSILMVIYGAVANASIGALLIGGALPGVLIGLALLVEGYVIAIRHDYPPEVERWLGVRAVLTGLWEALLPLGVPFIIVGGILSGYFTPTESAVVATLYAMFITMAVYRTVRWSDLVKLFGEAGLLTALIYITVAAATAFAWLLAFYRIPSLITEALLAVTRQPQAILLLIVALFIFLGTFMDATPAILIFVPIVQPIAASVGIHPIHLGVVVVMTMAFGLLTLPYGLCTLIACGVADFPVRQVLGMLHLLMLAEVVIILLSVFFPQLILLIPRLLAPQWL
ncbi:MAG: TRAP transporter large permease [candidate division NC10 bacterium]|nr:TRAP transporter large permease [candidate division NC10 bacterium]